MFRVKKNEFNYLQSYDDCQQPIGLRGSEDNDGDRQGQPHHGVGGGHPKLPIEPPQLRFERLS